jgi:hypothetical protein
MLNLVANKVTIGLKMILPPVGVRGSMVVFFVLSFYAED